MFSLEIDKINCKITKSLLYNCVKKCKHLEECYILKKLINNFCHKELKVKASEK